MPPPAPVVRFAPAPTGYLHVGGARSALFNWIYARQTGGRLVLRIEDTDQERNQPELIETILDSLRWLGIDWDEGPLHQSDRRDRYREAAEKLVADGRAYLVDADDNRVDGAELTEGIAARFATPAEGVTAFDDVIRGHVSFDHANLEDFVVWRSNGHPTFLLANAVDDADMGITHVIRGEDLLSSTPKVLLLREALGFGPPPVYAHLPLLVDESRQKLTKRKHAVAVGEYRDRGYLPEAMVNYLALLGWGPDDGVEIRPLAEIVEMFRLEDVTKGAAFFDTKKLDHINGTYIRQLSLDDFIERARPFLATGPWPADAFDAAAFERLAPLVQERVDTLAQIPGMVDFVFGEPVHDEVSWTKTMEKGRDSAVAMLDGALDRFAGCEWRSEVLHATTAEIGEAHGLKLGKAQAPIRVAVTGRTVGPPLFESLEVLGRDEVLSRIRTARERLD